MRAVSAAAPVLSRLGGGIRWWCFLRKFGFSSVPCFHLWRLVMSVGGLIPLPVCGEVPGLGVEGSAASFADEHCILCHDIRPASFINF